MSMGLSMLATVLGLLLVAGILDAAPYQELQPRAGYVPVYIREGETPLSEIHPGLAEAFHEENNKNLPSDGSTLDVIRGSSDDDDEPNSSNSNDDNLSDDLPEEPIDISSSEESNKRTDETKEPNPNVVEAAKEAIKELVSVFETDMLEKLGLSEDVDQPSTTSQNEQIIKTENQTSESHDSNSTPEKTSDVLTVEDFKAKDFNKDSIGDDEMSVPEDVPSYQ